MIRKFKVLYYLTVFLTAFVLVTHGSFPHTHHHHETGTNNHEHHSVPSQDAEQLACNFHLHCISCGFQVDQDYLKYFFSIFIPSENLNPGFLAFADFIPNPEISKILSSSVFYTSLRAPPFLF